MGPSQVSHDVYDLTFTAIVTILSASTLRHSLVEIPFFNGITDRTFISPGSGRGINKDEVNTGQSTFAPDGNHRSRSRHSVTRDETDRQCSAIGESRIWRSSGNRCCRRSEE